MKKMLKDKKINILKQKKGSDDYGEPIDELVTIADNIWAYYRQLSGREIYAAQTVNAQEEVLFEIGWRNDIDTTVKIQYRGDIYNVTRIDDFEGYKNDLKVFAYKDN